MKRLTILVFIAALVIMGLHIYYWQPYRGMAQLRARLNWMIVREHRNAGYPQDMVRQAMYMMVMRFERITDARLLMVVSLGIGALEGAQKRNRMRLTGYSRNVLLSSGLALAAAGCIVLGTMTAPYLVPYRVVIAALCGCWLWVGASVVIGSPFSRRES